MRLGEDQSLDPRIKSQIFISGVQEIVLHNKQTRCVCVFSQAVVIDFSYYGNTMYYSLLGLVQKKHSQGNEHIQGNEDNSTTAITSSVIAKQPISMNVRLGRVGV